MKVIERNQYLNKLINFKDKDLIKIVTGVRRCGKSTLLSMFEAYLTDNRISEKQIHYINFEDYDYYELRDKEKLFKHLKSVITSNEMNYVFLDEIQHVKDFPDVLDALYTKKNVDLYVTGSNAYMLSGEIATLISGRYVEIKMLPLSFKEYCEFNNSNSLEDNYKKYIETSSFPYSLEFSDSPSELNDYLEGLYNTIVLKDVMSRNSISDNMMLESVLRFVVDNIGNPLSSKKIADTLTSNGRKIDTKTVEKYLNAFVESFILYNVNRYNIKGKQYLKTLGKYYIVDVGLRKYLLGNRMIDQGFILENIVYLELRRRGYKVYVGKVDALEVDFVAINENELIYYQVSASIRNEKTFEREIASLESIKDNYKKYVLTLDNDFEKEYEGIIIKNALEWLLEE